jgi:hypothetical protein
LQRRLSAETTKKRDPQPTPSPSKTDGEQGDDPNSGVKSVASNRDKTHRRHSFPIDLSKLHRSSSPRFPTLASPTLGPEKAPPTRMIGVGETCTKVVT